MKAPIVIMKCAAAGGYKGYSDAKKLFPLSINKGAGEGTLDMARAMQKQIDENGPIKINFNSAAAKGKLLSNLQAKTNQRSLYARGYRGGAAADPSNGNYK